MNKAHQIQNWGNNNHSPETLAPHRTRDGPRGPDPTEARRDFITRWRQAILRTAVAPAGLKRTLPELSNYELAIYLAVKCRGGSARRFRNRTGLGVIASSA